MSHDLVMQKTIHVPASLGADGLVPLDQLPATMTPSAHDHTPDEVPIDDVGSGSAQLTDELIVWRSGSPVRVTVQSIIDLVGP